MFWTISRRFSEKNLLKNFSEKKTYLDKKRTRCTFFISADNQITNLYGEEALNEIRLLSESGPVASQLFSRLGEQGSHFGAKLGTSGQQTDFRANGLSVRKKSLKIKFLEKLAFRAAQIDVAL